MSESSVLTLGLAKEGFHELGQFLDSAQSAEGQFLHRIQVLHQLPRNSPLHMSPDLLIGIQLRGIRRQVEQFEASVLSLDERVYVVSCGTGRRPSPLTEALGNPEQRCCLR